MWVIADGYRNAIYNFNDVQAITIGRTYGEDGGGHVVGQDHL